MPRARVAHSFESPTVDVMIDMGHPFLNRTVDGFIKIGIVGAAHAGTQEIFGMLRKESVTKRDIEKGIKKMASEGVQWGVVAGIYTGMEYGMQQTRGRHDWKSAMLGGALTGALLTFGDSSYDKEKMLRSAITGGAIATAAEFLRILT
ncbi:hypothetical protein MPTK1_7g17400 [Marchantia polymorpha subsp. ruderalis]|uniref:Uncharacterized protein n=2 Tax=Marchantia polymorpha TaxID=3197 RepID=A0A176WQ93_MARPO|nr:hypothetical protein AXG93_392s1390 [Marchantia polymorpha subsp. ruderalis]PTQ38476.1 hypothetical protein MARPO_0051s0077 [Marchantia polymorpha]BBN17851.1 hypothetical protein Mp_7g17400 [Marchantia polymorpha subsp. ruderalis]|eukprot:PTQ38476.1 hypothetical protein MARPO_0051s0077 [Marchantia polymorpha]